MTVTDAELGQRVEHVPHRREGAAGAGGGVAEAAKVQPDGVTIGGQDRQTLSHIRRSATPACSRTTGRSPRGPARSYAMPADVRSGAGTAYRTRLIQYRVRSVGGV